MADENINDWIDLWLINHAALEKAREAETKAIAERARWTRAVQTNVYGILNIAAQTSARTFVVVRNGQGVEVNPVAGTVKTVEVRK